MLTLAFAQNAPVQAPQAQSNPLIGLMPIALIFIVFYFLLIRPQKKNQQEHAKMIENLQKNDEVVTAGGMYGTIVNIQNDIITLRVDDNTRIKVQKSSISKLKKEKSE
ncbi:MAG: preprotein translocase subunit YajC [Candidatus Omnitrophota bacterium]